MTRTAHFRFYEELNDFLSAEKKKKVFEHHFSGSPAIKDIIEAIGIPHPEIDLIIVNGKSVKFTYRLQDGDFISVYPVFESIDITPIVKLRPSPMRVTRFICDVNLGKLARWLRLCGFNTVYQNKIKDAVLVRNAVQSKRIILTRDQQLLKRKEVTHGYWVRNTNPDTQLQEVINRFDLSGQIKPFMRCMECNGKIEKVDKEKISDHLLPRTRRYFDMFYQCHDCKKVYWQGSHYERMIEQIQTVMKVD